MGLVGKHLQHGSEATARRAVWLITCRRGRSVAILIIFIIAIFVCVIIAPEGVPPALGRLVLGTPACPLKSLQKKTRASGDRLHAS